MKRRIALLAFLLTSLTAYSDLPVQPPRLTPEEFIGKTYEAVDALVSQFGRDRASTLAQGEPVIVATLVNIDELAESSRFGRSVSEQVASRLTQRGFKVIELKLRGNIFVARNQGELLLSREIREISLAHKAPSVVVGSYAQAERFVHVNLKVLDAQTQQALAATDYGLMLDENLKSLFFKGRY